MNKSITKKFIGTSLLVLLASVTLIIGTGNAKALFVFSGDRLDADGTVTSVAGSSFDLETNAGDTPLTIVVNRKTKFNGYDNLRDIQVGDFVTIRADRDEGDFIATRVRKTTPDMYGGGGAGSTRFVLNTAVYAGPNGDSFLVLKDGVPVEVHFDDQTDFRRGTFEDLLPGTELRIVGVDKTQLGYLYAERIVIVDNIGLERCNSYGSNAFVVYNQSPLIANEAEGSTIGPINAPIPAGKYKVIGVSYDNHSSSDPDNAPKEQWFATGINDGSTTFTSGITKDLPNNKDFNATVVNPSITLTKIDQIQFKHAAYPDPKAQSIYPVCLVFKPLGGGSGGRDEEGHGGSYGDDRHDRDYSGRHEEYRKDRGRSLDELLPEES